MVEDPSPEVWKEVFGDAGNDSAGAGAGSDRAGAGRAGTGRPLYLEIGCGRGDFLLQQALAHPEADFIGIEGQASVVLRAMEKAAAAEAASEGKADPAGGAASLCENLRFACAFVNGLEELFEPGSLSGIFLNFSDPWPKSRHAKRRLTYRGRLMDYANALEPGGFIAIKTDNDPLFDFTLEEIAACGWIPAEMTRDLHGAGCDLQARLVTTEYERKFRDAGKTINYVKVIIQEEQEVADEFILARGNGRTIPQEDKIFGISNRAKAAIQEKGADAVVNGTIGALLDDEGKLIVLESVDEVFHQLNKTDYAEYAPIGGIKPFREAVQKAAFGAHAPEGFKEAVATPGGTGSIRNVISNCSSYGGRIMTSDWHWAPYNTIAGEIGRSIATFTLFDENRGFNAASFAEESARLLQEQDSLVIILNTPAHNPTGYSLTLEDWDKVIASLCEEAKGGKPITLLIDAAYIDFAGDEDEYREFLPKLSALPENVLCVMAYSLSKTYTLYGGRCGAMICIAKTQAIADEFKRVCEFSSRGSWSNSAKLGQVILSRVYEDPALLARVDEERAKYRNMLIARGTAFSEAAAKAGLEIVPFDAGFFVSVPCADPDALSRKLEEKDVFLVPLKLGIRVSVASVSEEKCRRLPAIIKAAMDELGM